MNRGELYERLAQNKQLLDVATARFASLTEGLDHPRIRSARDMLGVSRAAVTAAAGGISGWTRTWIGTVVFGAAAWVVATLAGQVIGLPAGWTITVTVAVLFALSWPVTKLNDALRDRVNRRRTERPASPLENVAPVGPDPRHTSVGPDPADEIIMMLWRVRDGLTVLMKGWSREHRFGYVARSPAGFDWLRRHDRDLFGISLADRCLCQAIDSIELWIETRERSR